MKTMLWRSDDAPHVTILGSIHLLDGEPPSWAMEACEKADLMIFEAEPGPSPLPMDEGMSISSLAPALGRVVIEEASALGLNPDFVDRQFPFYASAYLGMTDAMQRFGLGPGIENVLLPLAKENEHPGFLEEPDEVFSRLFYTPPLDEQLRSLSLGLTMRRSGINPLGAVVSAWRRCDLETIWTEAGERALRHSPLLYEAMFPQRHAAWIDKTVEWIEWTRDNPRRLLIVVGCLHMTGPGNFLEYLGTEGYRFHRS